jgi:hypothetical protein
MFLQEVGKLEAIFLVDVLGDNRPGHLNRVCLRRSLCHGQAHRSDKAELLADPRPHEQGLPVLLDFQNL